MRAYVSLKDVALRAGVSFQTASKVLRGQRGVVAEDTQRRILQAAEELRYVPNAVARSLVTRSTYTIGIVADDLSDWILARFVLGAEHAARRRGHAVLIGTVRDAGVEEANEPAEWVRQMLERRVDGIVSAAPTTLEEDTMVADLLRGPTLAVSMNHVPGGGVSFVGSDHHRTGRLATEHLIGLGHRRIGTVTGPWRRRVVVSRLRGYRAALEAADIPYDEALVEEADWTTEGGFAATERLLTRVPDLSSVFVHSDLMAVGVLSALDVNGRRVPADCSVVGCDDIHLAAHLKPPLTSVHIPFYESGERAVELLLDHIQNPELPARRELLPVHLVVRESTLIKE